MEETRNPATDKRRFERRPLQLPAIYMWKNIECPCLIIDISSCGIGMRVKGYLETGDVLKIILGKKTISAKVVHVNGNIVGVEFDLITSEVLNYVVDYTSNYDNQ